MTIRCKKCHAVVWVRPAERGSRSASAACRGCGQEYVLEGFSKASGEPALAAAARQLAKDQSLDLPAAYSILLGLATADEMRELGDARSPACRTAPLAGPAPREHDSGFHAAIDAGLMTTRQAAERGSRDAFAAVLTTRHGLPMSLALDVADNRISLLQAIRQRATQERALRVEVRGRRLRTLALAGVLIVVALLALFVRRHEESPAGYAAIDHTLGGADVRSSGGDVIEVVGTDPRSVLRAYCAAASGTTRLEPLAVVPSALPGGRARIGLLRDPRRPDDLLAITIREDRKTGRWRAGDGGQPVVAEAAPAGAEMAVRGR